MFQFDALVQLGADKGGMYSYTWFETNILQCELVNADQIYEEWQDLKVGDKVKMCPDENIPPAYIVAMIEENDVWVEVWQFNLVPQDDGMTRLVIRSRSATEGWFWDIIRPGEFIMMRGAILVPFVRARLDAVGAEEFHIWREKFHKVIHLCKVTVSVAFLEVFQQVLNLLLCGHEACSCGWKSCCTARRDK